MHKALFVAICAFLSKYANQALLTESTIIVQCNNKSINANNSQTKLIRV